MSAALPGTDSRTTNDAPDCESEVLDLSHLRRYTLDDMALQKEVLDLFRMHIETSLEALGNSCPDASAWRMAAHTLKGSARAVGAFRLAQAAERAERNAESEEARAFSSRLIHQAAVVTLARLDS